MFQYQSATIINAGASVTPLNFRQWLREELVRQQFSGRRMGEVEAFVFVTKAFITALGRKKLDKIISDAVIRHPWIDEIQVVTTDHPITDEDARDYVEGTEFESTSEPDLSEFGLLLLGFNQQIEQGSRVADISIEACCVIRPIIEADVERMMKESSECPYVAGDFAVVGHVNDEAFFSDPFSTEEDAKAFATETYGAISFVETRGIA